MFLFILFVVCQLIHAVVFFGIVALWFRDTRKRKSRYKWPTKVFLQRLCIDLWEVIWENSVILFSLISLIGGFWNHWISGACIGLLAGALVRSWPDNFDDGDLNKPWEFLAWCACLGLGLWHHWMFYPPALIILIGPKRILNWMAKFIRRYPGWFVMLSGLTGVHGAVFLWGHAHPDLFLWAAVASLLIPITFATVQLIIMVIRGHKSALARAEVAAIARALKGIPRVVVNMRAEVWVVVGAALFEAEFARYQHDLLSGAKHRWEPIMVKGCMLFASSKAVLSDEEREIVRPFTDLNLALEGCYVTIHPQLGVPFVTRDAKLRKEQLRFLLGA